MSSIFNAIEHEVECYRNGITTKEEALNKIEDLVKNELRVEREFAFWASRNQRWLDVMLDQMASHAPPFREAYAEELAENIRSSMLARGGDEKIIKRFIMKEFHKDRP